MVDMMNLDDGGWDESMFDDIAGDEPDLVRRVTFLIDRSGSMDGTTIGTINTVMEELLSELDEHGIQIAVAEVDENVEWKTDVPVPVAGFGAWDRTRSGSFSCLGEAFAQMAGKLQKKEWKAAGKKGSRDYFVLFSDGLSTDAYQDGIGKLESIPAFQNGKRVVINFSDISNMELLSRFAGGENRVIRASGSGAIDLVENAILQMVK